MNNTHFLYIHLITVKVYSVYRVMAHPDFGKSVNPISTRGDRLCPTNYYWHTRIFRPSNGPVILVGVGSSGIFKAKQKLGVTFNFDKQGVIDFMKFSKMTMCRASEENS